VQPLTLEVPVNMRVAKRGVGGRVNGAFEESRVLYPLPIVVSPAQDLVVSIAPDSPQAQPVQLADQTIITIAIDLLLAVTKNGSLLIDLRDDLGGKPDTVSLLPKPVQFQIVGPIGVPSEGSDAAKASWVSVQLPAPFQFQIGRRYWLVVQSIEGEADWSVEPTKGTDVGMHRTQDGGLSWQLSTATAFRGPVAALFRLRGKPEVFTMPIEIEIGSEDPAKGLKPERVTLDRFAPLGRVDLTLDFDEVADGFNRFLDNAAPTLCPEGEHLVNGDFEKWLQIGDELMEPTAIDLDIEPEALAVSPDGSKAYVVGAASTVETAASAAEKGLLQVVDIVCGRVNKNQDLSLSAIPTLIVVRPDGRRGYVVVGGTKLQVIDLDAHQALGGPLSPHITEILSLALSLDGGLLFFSIQADVMMVDTTALEKFARGSGPEPQITSPDSRIRSPIPKSALPDKKFAVTPDEKWAVVLEDDSKITLIEMETESVVRSVPITGSGVAIGISPAGSHAYVARKDNTVGVIDLKRGVVVGEPIKVGESPIAIALTPNGDRILVANNLSSSLSSIQIGFRQPDEWNLVSGQVMPYCLPEPYHLIALLGSTDNATPSILSQVVPVAESCLYEIHFRGIASDEGAAAEVRWLDQNATLIGSDPERVPIDTVAVTFAFQQDGSGELGAAAAAAAVVIPQLSLHRKRLPAPKGATQAEIRFVVPGDVGAAIDNVSFAATTEAVVNADFSLRQDDRLAGWSLSPGAASGVSLVAIDSGIRLQNAGSEIVELVQTVPAKGGQLFQLQLESQVLRSKSNGNPRVEMHWLKDGVALADEIVREVPMDAFSSLGANGTSPDTATHAEIHLVVPPGATQDLKRVSLTFTPTVTVHLTFIAQAPGELTVSALRVAFEKAEARPPKVPDTGLFMPTPAENNCEEKPCEDRCFCACCKSDQRITDATPMKTETGHPVQVVTCEECGARLVRFGGPMVPDAPRFVMRPQRAEEPVVLTPSVPRFTPHRPDMRTAAPLPQLRDIDHIGEARERRLVTAGIDSVAKLAAASVTTVRGLLQPAVSEDVARKIIEDAARLARGQ
jgi:hypothetical protein